MTSYSETFTLENVHINVGNVALQARDFYVEMKWEFTSWGECPVRVFSERSVSAPAADEQFPDTLQYLNAALAGFLICNCHQGPHKNAASISSSDLFLKCPSLIIIDKILIQFFSQSPWCQRCVPATSTGFGRAVRASAWTPPSWVSNT